MVVCYGKPEWLNWWDWQLEGFERVGLREGSNLQTEPCPNAQDHQRQLVDGSTQPTEAAAPIFSCGSDKDHQRAVGGLCKLKLHAAKRKSVSHQGHRLSS